MFCLSCAFLFKATQTTEFYTLSLHDALPIYPRRTLPPGPRSPFAGSERWGRSEEHTSELQSLRQLVCRLLIEKKNYCRLLSENHQSYIITNNDGQLVDNHHINHIILLMGYI